ncbi:hypothetical protein EON65_36055 [archaeon]|nr:MAG: hypothetical protein EON65_36055 [archaeon]
MYEKIEKSNSCPTLDSQVASSSGIRRSNSIDGSQKKVGFSSKVVVVLIPEVKEYKSANLQDDLWWTQEDFNQFKAEMRMERRILKAIYCNDPSALTSQMIETRQKSH